MGHKDVAGLIVALTIYILSIGPVFAYYVHRYYDASGAPMPLAVFQLYRPLLCGYPEPTNQYLRFWGVSEIEVFFITDPQQHVPEPQAE
jgi:hypothetical protein